MLLIPKGYIYPFWFPGFFCEYGGAQVCCGIGGCQGWEFFGTFGPYETFGGVFEHYSNKD